ncbi:MAG: 2-hydroxyacyl-CoA dehydratase [Burkholderiales bacterium]|nr:2-hydroxyacyl-CoA dehydratase [Burkholderiales bacterium]
MNASHESAPGGRSLALADVIDPALVHEVTDVTALGIDIGSRNSKAVLIHEGRLHTALLPTGINMQETAQELLDELFQGAGIALEDIDFIVGTGYGRVSLKFTTVPCEILTEISCHAMGAHYLNAGTRTIIDIGGQDAKAIQVDPETGKVVKFRMNDKCAAGTGRFLEKAANLLDLTMYDVGPESLKSQKELEVSSQCVVFAESEVISHRAKGEVAADISAGVHMASAKRVTSLLRAIPLESDIVFTGGVSNNVGMKRALEKLLDKTIVMPRLDMVFAGCLGAAVYAQRLAVEARKAQIATTAEGFDLSDLSRRIEDAELSLIERKDVKKVGTLCTYTPPELLTAAGVAFGRIDKCGSPPVVAEGEVIVKSVMCDMSKSVIGHFRTKDPFHDALDQVVTFYTCDTMRATSNAINHYFKPSYGYVVPRVGDKPSAREFFRGEMIAFKQDLEKLTGSPVEDAKLRESISLHRKLRQTVRKISELRKRNRPPLTGTDFLEITRAYRSLPAEEQLPVLDDLYQRLSAVPDDDAQRLRMMICGGIIADGDRRLMDLLEKDIGVQVVVEDHCTGLSPFYYDLQDSDDPYRDLANAYLDQAPCARQSPLTRRIDFAAMLAEEYKVDAVIYYTLKFCPSFAQTKGLFLRRFHQMGLPALDLDTDYSQGDTGQIKTRLEAFVEVLKEARKGTQGEKTACAA